MRPKWPNRSKFSPVIIAAEASAAAAVPISVHLFVPQICSFLFARSFLQGTLSIVPYGTAECVAAGCGFNSPWRHGDAALVKHFSSPDLAFAAVWGLVK